MQFVETISNYVNTDVCEIIKSYCEDSIINNCGTSIIPLEQSLPMVEQSLPMVEQSLPMVEQSLPMVEQSLPMVERRLPMSEAIKNISWIGYDIFVGMIDNYWNVYQVCQPKCKPPHINLLYDNINATNIIYADDSNILLQRNNMLIKLDSCMNIIYEIVLPL